jgi:hypothetical protein
MSTLLHRHGCVVSLLRSTIALDLTLCALRLAWVKYVAMILQIEVYIGTMTGSSVVHGTLVLDQELSNNNGKNSDEALCYCFVGPNQPDDSPSLALLHLLWQWSCHR